MSNKNTEQVKLDRIKAQIEKLDAEVAERLKKREEFIKQKEAVEAIIAQKQASSIIKAMQVRGLSIDDVLNMINAGKASDTSSTSKPDEKTDADYKVRGSLDEILNG